MKIAVKKCYNGFELSNDSDLIQTIEGFEKESNFFYIIKIPDDENWQTELNNKYDTQ